MPVHRCTFDALEEAVAAIEASGEQIVSVVAPYGTTVVIVTAPSKRVAPKGVERR